MRILLALLATAAWAQNPTRLAPDQIRDSSTTPPSSAITVRSITTSSTQAVMTYTAPDANPCHVVISEGNGQGPPVIDVNPQLFTAADDDSRPTSAVNGKERIFVAGARRVDKALDGKYYSRALQAYADHWYRITCGTAQIAGTFRTANIPSGVTFADALQVDPARPGKWMLPTQEQDRKQTIRDPLTGALLKRMSLDAEARGSGMAGFILSYGGMVRNCGIERIQAPDGTSGYLCTIFDPNAMGALYWVVPATGETRYLGIIYHGYPYVSGQKTFFWTDGNTGNTFKSSYIGDFKEVAPLTAAAVGPDVFYSGPTNAMLHAFDPTFDPALFGCGSVGADAGKYSMFTCGRSGQDSYGWVAAFYGGDGRPVDPNCTAGDACPRIVAAMNVMDAYGTRWCGLHNQQLVPGYPLISINYQRLADWSNAIGRAPWQMTLTQPINDGTQTVIRVNGNPVPNNSDPYRQPLKPHDLIAIASPDEVLEVKAVADAGNGQLDVTVQRDRWAQGNPHAWPAGTVTWQMCTGWNAMGYWKFLEDLHGTDQTGQHVVNDYYWGYGGHMDNGPLGRVEEAGGGWQSVHGDIMQNLNKPVDLIVPDTVKFAGGLTGLAYGSTTSKHPSYHQDAAQTTQAQQKWYLDFTPFDGSNVISDSSRTHLVSGQLYQYYVAPGYGAELRRKGLPTSASTGGDSLRDVSGPNSHISDLADMSYTFCVVDQKPGECRQGSQLGDIFVNAPSVQYRYCSGGDGPNPGNKDLCVGNANPYYQAVTQVYMSDVGSDDATQKSRVLTYAMAGLKNGLYYSLAKSLPDSSWTIFTSIDPNSGYSHAWIAKVPPLDTVGDGIDRTTFIPKPVVVPKPADPRITGVRILFGYLENGPADQYQCTTRADSCYVNSSSVNPAQPFFWAHEGPPVMPCADGCTVSIPLAPMHTAYYRIDYYDSSGQPVAYSPVGVVIDGQDQPIGRRRGTR